MMKNKHLSKAIASQKFFEFKTKLMSKCKENHIELRIVDRFFIHHQRLVVIVERLRKI